jgi:hypothetical protein
MHSSKYQHKMPLGKIQASRNILHTKSQLLSQEKQLHQDIVSTAAAAASAD